MLAFPMPRLLSPILERKSLHAPGGSLPVAVHFSQTCFDAPLFSWSYKLLFPQALYFEKHLRCPPGVTPNCSRPSGIHIQNESTLLSSYSYGLFVVAKKIICIGISNFHTLSQKHPGWVCDACGVNQNVISRCKG